MELKVIATGSSGNSFFLSNKESGLLLDAGVSSKKIIKALNYNVDSIEAVCLTHFHGDHSKAIPDLVRNGIPIIMTDISAMAVCGELPYCKMQSDSGVYETGDWIIKPFDVEHDCPGTIGFLIYNEKTQDIIVYLSDTGYTKFIPHKPTVIIVECNYIPELLDQNQTALGDRYLRLKKYHFGLNRVINYLKAIDRSLLRHIVLMHMSKTNSDEDRVVSEINDAIGIMPVIAKAGLTIDLGGNT
jgi:phosphoribosyl 1,2-cyclic phosphodiesterase